MSLQECLLCIYFDLCLKFVCLFALVFILWKRWRMYINRFSLISQASIDGADQCCLYHHHTIQQTPFITSLLLLQQRLLTLLPTPYIITLLLLLRIHKRLTTTPLSLWTIIIEGPLFMEYDLVEPEVGFASTWVIILQRLVCRKLFLLTGWILMNMTRCLF